MNTQELMNTARMLVAENTPEYLVPHCMSGNSSFNKIIHYSSVVG